MAAATATATATASFPLTRFISSPKSFSNSTPKSFIPHKTFSSKPKPLKFTSKISATIAQGDTLPKATSSTIAVGDTLPEATFSYFDYEEENGDLKTITVSELTKGKKTVLIAVPGAFVRACSVNFVPGYCDLGAKMRDKGVDTIACIAVNDAFVMKHWKIDFKIVYPTVKDIMFLSDGNATFTRAIGCELNLLHNPLGLGFRSRRYAMIVEDGVIKTFHLEKAGGIGGSVADIILEAL